MFGGSLVITQSEGISLSCQKDINTNTSNISETQFIFNYVNCKTATYVNLLTEFTVLKKTVTKFKIQNVGPYDTLA
jgi:hypothetical protein